MPLPATELFVYRCVSPPHFLARVQMNTENLVQILTLDETAILLRINRATLLELVKRKQIPSRQVGRQWRFSRDHVLAWLSGNDRVLHLKRNKDGKT